MAESKSLRMELSEFSIMQTLGIGSFGRVRLAQHRETKIYYALKILKKSEVVRLKQVDHIMSENDILAKIDHPFMVNMLGLTQNDRYLYLVLEYVQGGELFTYLRS
jgi:protein kinase X